MKNYVGLDVSSKTTHICIVNELSEIVHRGLIKTDPDKIAEHLLKTGLQITKIGIESSSLSNWLVESLKALDLPAICIDSRSMAAFISLQINKTDKNDAEAIAKAMQCGAYKAVHCKSIESIDKVNLLGARSCLVRQRTNVSNTVRGLLKSYGIRIKGSGQKLFPESVRRAINELPDFVKLSFDVLLQTLEILYMQVDKLDAEVDKVVKGDALIQKFKRTPGVGPITATMFRATIDNPKRFKNARACAASVGLTPREYSSGDVVKLGRISKQGSSELRGLLVECAESILTRTTSWSKLKVWGTKLMLKKGLKKARVAVARKLVLILYRTWLDDTEFVYGEVDEKIIEKLTKEKEAKKRKKTKKEKELAFA